MTTSFTADRRWTGRRQLVFLDTLAQTRCVNRAAAVAGMSRESAYRLRRRPAGALFAALWDRVMLGHTNSKGFVTRKREPAVLETLQNCPACPCRDPRILPFTRS